MVAKEQENIYMSHTCEEALVSFIVRKFWYEYYIEAQKDVFVLDYGPTPSSAILRCFRLIAVWYVSGF